MAEESTLSQSLMTCVEWKIRNFSNLRTKVNHSIESPRFTLSGVEFYLDISPKGESKFKSFGWIGLYLMKEETEANYRVVFKIGIKKGDGCVLADTEDEWKFKKIGDGRGTDKLIKRSTLLGNVNNFDSEGSLTVFCNAMIVNGPSIPLSVEMSPSPAKSNQAASQTPSPTTTVEVASQTSSTIEISSQTSVESTRKVLSQTSSPTGEAALKSDGMSTLLEDFKNMYINSSYTDITIQVQNKIFSAHRSILAARSVVFAAMFKHELEEKSNGKVEITDCNPDSFEQFLLFLYTGKMDELTPTKAVHLYMTADKYDVKELKEKCVRCMVRDVSVDSFCDVVHLAAIHSDSDLLKAATDFFIGNIEDIMSTTKWQDLLTENPLLCNELFFKVIKSKK